MKRKLLLLLLVITLIMSTACVGLIQGIIGNSPADDGNIEDNPVDDGILEPTPRLPNNNQVIKDPDRNNPGNNDTSPLTVESARALAREWLSNHPVEDGPNTLDSTTLDFTHNNKEYYQFFLTTPQMYWFNILVQKETGEMLLLIIEDGMDGGLYVEPLDEWYDNVFGDNYFSSGIDSLWAAILDAQNQGIVVLIAIYWENGSQTTFYNDYFDGWYMISRTNGNQSSVSPGFSKSAAAVEIRFPTTTRIYYLYDDYTGIFGDEKFTWDYMLP